MLRGRGFGNNRLQQGVHMKKPLALAIAAAFTPLMAHAQTTANTLPAGGQVTAGSAMISTSGSNMQIDQSTDKAILNWQSFSIGSGASVNFSQPNASSVALNRVVGNNPSEIFGRLSANGQVFLVNNSGVLFAPTASVDVGSLFATTLSINDQDFLAGRYQFYNPGNSGSVVNQGTIITANGYTALAGPQVRNDGLILARAGTVALAAGDRVSLDMIGDGLIRVNVDQAALNASAVNTGRIEADGGTVLLTARSANALLDTVINTSGVVRANALIERDGEIVLDAGSNGGIRVTGGTQATHVAVSGGSLHVQGQVVADTISVHVADAVLVDRGGQISSRFGQSISADSLTVRGERPGEFSSLGNETGNQAITVTGAGGISVEAANGGFAVLGKLSPFGVRSMDSQTIRTTRLHVDGGAIQANEQNITVHGDVSVHNGSVTTNAGNQIIAVSGGNVDVRATAGGGAWIQSAGGAVQSITVADGDHINIIGEAGFAGLQANVGVQTVSITGTGANALNIGAVNATGSSTVNGLNQSITAGNAGESGSITITGSGGRPGFTHIANIGAGVANPQTVRTSGTLSVTGGTAAGAGIFQNNPAEQRISASNVVLQGGASGVGTGAFINSTFGGGQVFTVPGEIRVTAGAGGAAGIFNGANNVQTISAPQTINAGSVALQGGPSGSGNGAFINSNFGGDQTLNVSGDIVIAAGAGGNAGILGSGSRQQTIFADNIRLTNSAGGAIESVGFIQGGHQEIHAAGDVTLTARAAGGALPGVRIGGSAGSPTDLRLFVGGDLVLTGGTAANNGVGIGSSASVGGLANEITIEAGGSVILNSGTASGTGARIGSPAAGTGPGNIEIRAGNGIELNGVAQSTAIRTLGTVTLVADHIVEGSNGFIVAGTLNTATTGDASLTGPNQVSQFSAAAGGDVMLNNTGPRLTVTSITAEGITLRQSGALDIIGNVASSAAQTISATGDITIGADGNAVEVRAGGPLTISTGGDLSVTAGTAAGAHASLFSSGDINLTVGGFLTLDGNPGRENWARVQTDTRDSAIRVFFPNLSSGGYFVNGVEGQLRAGHTGFLAGNGIAVPGHQFITTYGAP
jgi:filamentous hemagglutinin family protein